VQAHGLLEQLAGVAARPPGAERHPGHEPVAAALVAVVGGLLEQGHPGLLPQPAAEEGGRVAGHRQHRRGGHGGRVPGGAEAVGVHAQVHLEGGVGALQGDVVADQLDRLGVGALDADPDRLLAQAA
jgi:hypothetical protein